MKYLLKHKFYCNMIKNNHHFNLVPVAPPILLLFELLPNPDIPDDPVTIISSRPNSEPKGNGFGFFTSYELLADEGLSLALYPLLVGSSFFLLPLLEPVALPIIFC